MPRKMKKSGAAPADEPPAKRTKLFSDDEGSDDEVQLNINQEFANRFEHNKKREEMQRLEEKFKDDDSDDDSTSEEEDDAADLATADLDAEIFATLDAIKKKDPRVYNPDVTFYTPFDPDNADQGSKKEKPMYLSDYHRQNLLQGKMNPEEDDDVPVQTYAQEQQALKDDLIKQMHAAGDNQDDEEDEEDDGFVRKSRPAPTTVSRDSARPKINDADVTNAERDPETFLSNFMASRAWVPDESARFQAFDSDDSEDERLADEVEVAYNMRFEDPSKANEKLMTFSRDIAKITARREEKSGRKKQREKERERKDAIKKQRDEEKARLRKLKIDEVEEKVKKIKEAAGLKNQALDLNDWKQVLDEDWDDNQWETEMKRRFGDNYYEDQDPGLQSDAEEGSTKKSKKPKKPEWNDDIDIGDIIPDFKDELDEAPAMESSDDDEGEEGGAALNGEGMEEEEDAAAPDGSTKRKSKQDRLKERADQRRVARKERMAIEELVDADLTTTLPVTSNATGFRYRETSPTTFGLTARDILFADDSALNTFAGLKKMATWRDADKKKKDKKHLGKKARLRQWRKETFGNEDGFSGGFKEYLGDKEPVQSTEAPQGGSRKRRGKKRKAGDVEA